MQTATRKQQVKIILNICIVVLILCCFQVHAADRTDLGIGVFDIRGKNISTAISGSYSIDQKYLNTGPVLGLISNTDGAVMGYGGLYTDLVYKAFIFAPFLGLGGYNRGNSKDMGGVFEFIFGGNISYQLQSDTRIGIDLKHISNAFIHSKNPGTEILSLSYSF